MADFILMEGDKANFLPNFGAAMVVAMIHERKKDDAAGRMDAGGETGAAEPGAGNGGGE